MLSCRCFKLWNSAKLNLHATSRVSNFEIAAREQMLRITTGSGGRGGRTEPGEGKVWCGGGGGGGKIKKVRVDGERSKRMCWWKCYRRWVPNPGGGIVLTKEKTNKETTKKQFWVVGVTYDDNDEDGEYIYIYIYIHGWGCVISHKYLNKKTIFSNCLV